MNSNEELKNKILLVGDGGARREEVQAQNNAGAAKEDAGCEKVLKEPNQKIRLTTFIYSLSCPTTGEIRYIGKSDDPKRRLVSHCCDAERSHKTNWITSLKRIGQLPVVKILYECKNEDWKEVEMFWIACMRSLGCRLTNLSHGGCGPESISEESKRKMSLSHIGKRRSRESILKMILKNTGLKRSPETIKKMKLAQGGRKISEAQKMILRSCRLGSVTPEHVRKKISNSMKKAMTDERRAAISMALRNRIIRPESIAKTAAANRGRKNSHETIMRMRMAQQKRHLLKALSELGANVKKPAWQSNWSKK